VALNGVPAASSVRDGEGHAPLWQYFSRRDQLQEDACRGLRRAARGDEPACQGQIDLGVVRHHCGPREVEAETAKLVKPPETSSARLIGLIRLEGQLDLLAVIHAISRIDATTEPAMGHATHLASQAGLRRA
jgi:hypothetical protein